MKKRMLCAVLAPVVAALLITGCPSDPVPPPPLIENPDVEFVNGIFLYEFSSVTIEDTKEYEVIINIDVLDDPLVACHFQGELYYTLPNNTNRYLQANNINAKPQNIADYGKKYRLTLQAGNMGSTEKDRTDAVQKEGYTLTGGAGGPAVTTPANATQYLRLLAKTPRWYKMGVPTTAQEKDPANDWDNFDVDYYQVGITMGFNGEITIRLKPNYTFTAGDTIAANENVNDDGSGTGNIRDEEFEKLLNLPEGSVLRVVYDVPLVTSGGGGSNAQPGWGIAEFGAYYQTKVREQNLTVEVAVPQDAQVPSSGDYRGTTDVLIDDIVQASEPDWTFLNVYNGATIISMTIMRAALAP